MRRTIAPLERVGTKVAKFFGKETKSVNFGKGSSQKFTHRGQTKELSYGREGVWTRFVVRSTVTKKKKGKSATDRAAVLANLQ